MSFFESFWDLIGWFLSAFIFIAYLMVLFSIIGDLFRDRDLNGWAKALWIIFLVFLPFLTALVYLIARGKGMAERQIREVDTARSAANEYIREVAGSSPADEIGKAKTLFDSGAITQAEYDRLKERALAGQ